MPFMSYDHSHELEVGAAAIDGNGHANNVEFVRWMQDAAVAHADGVGCTAAVRAIGATWVVRSHHVEYLRPAFAGDKIKVRTWVKNFRRAFSLRCYQITRVADGVVLANGQTEWVFIDATTGRPKSVPAHIQAMFELAPAPGAGGH
jgi:acyl-CoA thioester hydrolase